MQVRKGVTGKYVRTGAIVLLLLALGIAAYVGLAKHHKTYRSQSGEYTVQYPGNWEPVDSNGVVTFYEKDNNSESKANVTIVMSAMTPDWKNDFENSLANAFAGVGARFALLEKSKYPTQGRPVDRYVYSLSLNGNDLKNTVYIFEIGTSKAAVMTCSGPHPRDASLDAQFSVFTETFRIN